MCEPPQLFARLDFTILSYLIITQCFWINNLTGVIRHWTGRCFDRCILAGLSRRTFPVGITINGSMYTGLTQHSLNWHVEHMWNLAADWSTMHQPGWSLPSHKLSLEIALLIDLSHHVMVSVCTGHNRWGCVHNVTLQAVIPPMHSDSIKKLTHVRSNHATRCWQVI